MIIGENRTFDHVFATYKPKNGETVDNLLSKRIINEDGTLGPNYSLAVQYSAVDNYGDKYQVSPMLRSLYEILPSPLGPFQLTSSTMPYDAYTASPVHRFYQMWQQLDCNVYYATISNASGCQADLFPWVEVTVGAGTNGKAQPPNFQCWKHRRRFHCNGISQRPSRRCSLFNAVR